MSRALSAVVLVATLVATLGASAQAEPPPASAPPPSRPSAREVLAASLADPVRALVRRQRFARAVEQISRQLGRPISAAQALAEMPCGGWSGPSCSHATIGIEIAKLALPLAARLYDDRAGRIVTVLAEAVSNHSVWHDAYGFVQEKLGRGPGYTYAGCLFGRCAAADFTCGQIDGLLYQLARLIGVLDGPECGPRCDLSSVPPPAPPPR